MSIRDELTRVIESVTPYDGITRLDYLVSTDFIASEIVGNFGVVALAKPDMGPDPEDEPDPRDGLWDLPHHADLELFRDGTATINGELSQMSAKDMRAVASALLTAARLAEENQS